MSDVFSIDLSKYADRFEAPARINGLNRVNFIYGKNGTGKSTICDAIRTEFPNQYDVRIFQGFDNLLSGSPTLNAFALGVENVDIQQQVAALDSKIKTLRTSIDPTAELDNPQRQVQEFANKEMKAKNSIKSFTAREAKRIKDLSNPQVTTTAYDRNDFMKDIPEATQLYPEAIKLAKETLREEGDLPTTSTAEFPSLDILVHVKRTNDLLKFSISQSAAIAEIGNNTLKRNFASEGMEIHSRNSDEHCAFCGGLLTPERWAMLDSYFSDSEKTLKDDLNSEITTLNALLIQIRTVKYLSQTGFYNRYTTRLKTLNNQIDTTKISLENEIEVLLSALNRRKENILKTEPEVHFDTHVNFQDIIDSYGTLSNENTEYASNLEQQQREAKQRLRLHEVWNSLQSNEYGRLKQEEEEATTAKLKAQEEVDSITTKITRLENQKTTLLAQTRDESRAARAINTLLKSLGYSSFELILEKTPGHGTGNYSIQSTDGRIRAITELSTGEKNIIAFLYFMEKLQTQENMSKPKLVVLDDPMNSNDDTVQFLMMGVIKQYYDSSAASTALQTKHKDILIVLTHNSYFYLNVRPYKINYSIKEKNPYRYFHLRRVTDKTFIQQVTSKDQDIDTAYASLWHDLRFAYDNNRPGFMWNSMRRIITTFAKFNGITIEALLDKTDKIADNTIGCALHKALNVNSHELLDFEFDSSVCDKDELIGFFNKLFSQIGHMEHFNQYWPDFEPTSIKVVLDHTTEN